MCKQGTILIELIVVLIACISIFLLGIQFFSGAQHIVTRLELTLLAISIKTMQQTSLLTGTDQKISFYDNGSGYNTTTSQHTFTPGINLCIPSGAFGPPATPHKPIRDSITFKNRTIQCTKHGIVQPGTVYIGNIQQYIFYALTSGIAQVSFIRLYKYQSKWIPL